MTKLSINNLKTNLNTPFDIALRGERPAHAVSQVKEQKAKGDMDSGERALIRNGHEVRVEEHGIDSMRVKSPTRLKPGTRTDLQLLEQRRTLRGEIERCRIIRLNPLCYEAIFVFHQSVAMPETHHV